MAKVTAVLESGTVGTFDGNENVVLGEVVTVRLHDENGNHIQETGVLIEVLDVSEH